MNFIKKGIKESIKAIKEHKILFSVALLVQIFIIGIIISLSINYPQKIYQDIEGISGPLQNANYNATSIEAGMPFSSDMATVYKSYNSLINHLQEIALWCLMIFIMLEAIIWIIAVRMQLPSKYRLIEEAYLWGKYWLKYLVAAMVFIFIPLMIMMFITKIFMSNAMEDQAVSMISIIFVILAVGAYLFLNFIAQVQAESWKAWIKAGFKSLIRKGVYTFSIFLINAMILAATLGLIVLSLSYQVISLAIIPLSLLLWIELVVLRVFWVSSLHSINREEHKREHEQYENSHN